MKSFNKWGFYLFTGLILLIFFIFLLFYGLIEWQHSQGKKELTQFLQELSDKGEPVTPEELDFNIPQETSDGYYKIQELCEKLSKSKKERQPILDEILHIFKTESVVYALDYDSEYYPLIELPYYFEALQKSGYFRTQSNLILKDIEILFHFIAATKRNNFLDTENSRQDFLRKAFLITKKYLNEYPLSQEQLQKLSYLWGSFDYYSQYSRAIQSKRAYDYQYWNSIGDNPDQIIEIADSWDGETYTNQIGLNYPLLYFHVRTKMSYEKIFYLKRHQISIEALEKLASGLSYQKIKKEVGSAIKETKKIYPYPKKLDSHISMSYTLLYLVYPIFPEVIYTENQIRQTQIAIALKQFQLQHNSYPENLSELTPHFLPSIPVDPFDGKPMRYQRKSNDSFLLYSVGEDFIDDGGNPTPKISKGKYRYLYEKDLIWPRP